MLEEVEFVIDERPIEFPNTIGVSEKVRARVGQIIPRTIRYVMRNFDLFHLRPINRVRAEIAGDGGHTIPREN
jgi:hypothetical protein